MQRRSVHTLESARKYTFANMKLTRQVNLTLARPTKWRELLWISSARTWKRSMVATSPPLETETSSPQMPDARQKGITASTDPTPAKLDLHSGGSTEKVSGQLRKPFIRWSSREIETLIEASHSEKPARAFKELLPGRPLGTIARWIRLVRALGPAALAPKLQKGWTSDELSTLMRLRRAGIRDIDMVSYFPDRSVRSIRVAYHRFEANESRKLERKGRPYTATEDDLVIGLTTRGIPYKLIAHLLGRTLSGISSRIEYFGLTHARRVWTPEKDERLSQLYKDGLTMLEIASTLGITVPSAKRRWFAIRPPESVRNMASRPRDNLTLTFEQVRELEESRDRGLTWRSIQAQEFPDVKVGSLRSAYERQGGRVSSYSLKNPLLMSSADVDLVQRLRNEGKTWQEISELSVFSGRNPDSVARAFKIRVAVRRRQESKEAPSSGSGDTA